MTSSFAARQWTRVRRLVSGVPFLVTVAVILILGVAYTLAGFFLVPRLALEAMLNERAGAGANEDFQTDYEKSTGKKAERANPALSIVGRGSPDREFYQALFRRLVETAPLSDTELNALGRRRGEATTSVLKASAGSSAGRVEMGDTEAANSAEGSSVPTRLELGAVGS